MLSQQQTSNTTPTDQRQQQQLHRRQQSTPTVHQEAQFYPAQQQPQFQAAHRRGMSLNQPVAQLRQRHMQDGQLVGITNTGQSQQHYLQEAQQHYQARPGQQHPQHQHLHQQAEQQQQLHQHQVNHSLQLSAEEFRQLQHQQLDAHIDSLFHIQQQNAHSFAHNQQHLVKIERSRSHPEAYNGMALATPPLRSANGSPNQVLLDPKSLDNGADASSNLATLRPNLAPKGQRPFTPPDQVANHQHPLTPATSPYAPMVMPQAEHMERQVSQEDVHMATIRGRRSPLKQVPQSAPALVRLSQSSVRMDPNSTIKARHHQRGTALQQLEHPELFPSERVNGRPGAPPSPQHTSPHRASNQQEIAILPNEEQYLHLSYSPSGSEAYFDSAQSIPGSSQTSPQMFPAGGSPHMNGQQFSAAMMPLQSVSCSSSPAHTAQSSIDFDLLDSPTRAAMSPKAMSISDLNLDATIEDTGISAEEVQSYISQPDPETGKWTCMYPECGKMFGRKENVRAHVQTHLGDRQFKCIHCGKCFVRQHDLKRHSKTHSGVKPYPCRCGNSFARHDALTRHRQRGICTGGFEGVVKRVVKRGRPRKERPSREDRLDKAARTRQRAAAKSYASSVSGTSESSYPESPGFLLEDMDSFDAKKAGVLQTFNSQSFTLDPEMLNFTGPPSPYSAEETPSPRKPRSIASGHTPPQVPLFDEDQTAAIFEEMNVKDSQPTAAGSSVPSQVGSPPELSHSSPPSSTRLLDFDFGPSFNSSSGSAPDEASKKQQNSSSAAAGQANDEFEYLAHSPGDTMFTSSWNENSFLNFDKDTGGSTGNLFGTSFDDEIMFTDACEPGVGGSFF